ASLFFALLVEEGRTRQCRGQVVLAALRTSPPRRCAPPLLVRGGECFTVFALLVEEGRTRQCRGQVVLRRLKPHHPGAARHPSSCEEGNASLIFCPPRGGGQDATMSRTGGPAALETSPPRRCAPPLLDEEGSASRFCP